MNGSFNVKKLEERLEKIADSLASIAGLFGPIGKKKPSAEDDLKLPEIAMSIPEFDPMKIGGGKKKG